MRSGPTSYLDDVSFTLTIEVLPGAPQTIVSMKANDPHIWDDECQHFVEADPSQIVFVGSRLVLHSDVLDYETGLPTGSTTTQAFDGRQGCFTLEELVDCVVQFERVDRPKTNWCGGVDRHHIFFEGLEPLSDGSYRVLWGS